LSAVRLKFIFVRYLILKIGFVINVEFPGFLTSAISASLR